MKPSWSFTRGLMIGAGLMYLMDPSEGGRRRAQMRDQGTRALRRSGRLLGKTGRDLRNRARGRLAEAVSRLRSGDAPDWVIEERVRSKLGRVVSHPHAIDVESVAGRITLYGPILRQETSSLLSAVQEVPGVLDVESRLEEHDSGEHVPALQGGRRRGEETSAGPLASLPRALQFLAAGAGAVAVAYGARRALEGRLADRTENPVAPNYAYLR
jgi:hypothetical protein